MTLLSKLNLYKNNPSPTTLKSKVLETTAALNRTICKNKTMRSGKPANKKTSKL
jgi:hypothetical protein